MLRTEHFNIYYYDDFEQLAKIGAYYAEEAFEEFKVKFNHYVTTKIPLIFYNTHIHFQQTNITPGFIPEGVGGFFEFMKGRVVIPYLGSLESFKHVIRHELVHVFMTNKIFNVLRDHRIDTERMPPLWFVEGLAEYWSYEWDTQAEMVMRDFVLNNYFVPLHELDAASGYLIYKEGQNFLEFVSKNYGEEKIIQLLDNFWRFNSFKDNLEFTLGESIQEIGNKWYYSLQQKYFPLFKDNFPHFIKSKKLTNEGYNFEPKFFDNNGVKEIYFIGNRNGYSSVFKMKFNPDNSEPEKPEVLIEGEKQPEFEAFHLLDKTLDVSKDGKLAFVTKSLYNDVIHIYSIKEKKIIETLRFNNLITIRSPSFSSDGKLLLFTAADRKGFTDIYIYNFIENKLTRITNDYYSDIDPVFNKDNTKIIFASDRTAGEYQQKYNLFEYNLNDNSIYYLTYVNANISSPQFTPDYSELFFNCDYDGTYNIWKLKYNSNNSNKIEQVTKFLTSVYSFTFINDSSLVTSAFEKYSFQFYYLVLSENENNYSSVNFDLLKSRNLWLAKEIVVPATDERLKYETEYTLDYAVGQLSTDPIYGSRGGALFSLSDLMGDDRYLFYIYNTAEVQSEILKNFNVAISKISLKKRTNYGFGVFHYAGRRYDITESDEFFYERVFGGYFELHYPFSSFQRIEADVSIANSDKEIFGNILPRKSLLVSNSLSFVHDNSIWSQTGPIDGSRFRILLGYTSDVKYSNVNYYSFIFDYRKYFRLGLRSSFATRFAFFINQGKQARRYFAGGSWDLRGWPRWSIRGQKLWLSSFELRFPLIDKIQVNFPLFGLSIFNVRGAVYFDAGSAWDKSYKETLGSIGFGFRINLFNAITLRYDIGKKIENNFSRFQPKLFYQFFFGWDF
ncbi:hypothetical protein [Rosettibacter firmus]|uniref:hypothetical protein n=1 Tax=Rosettibacter firmus TaxID=3111522 RepID=UPI00336C1A93